MDRVVYRQGLTEAVNMRATEIAARRSAEDAAYAARIYRGATAYSGSDPTPYRWDAEKIEWITANK